MKNLIESLVEGIKPSRIIDIEIYAKETFDIVQSFDTKEEKLKYLNHISSSKPLSLQFTKLSVAFNIINILKL